MYVLGPAFSKLLFLLVLIDAKREGVSDNMASGNITVETLWGCLSTLNLWPFLMYCLSWNSSRVYQTYFSWESILSLQRYSWAFPPLNQLLVLTVQCYSAMMCLAASLSPVIARLRCPTVTYFCTTPGDLSCNLLISLFSWFICSVLFFMLESDIIK